MPPLRDAFMTAVLAVLCLASFPALDGASDKDRAMDAGAALLVLVAAGATAGRTRVPVPALVAVAAATCGYLLLGYPFGPILVCLAVAVWSAARHSDPTAASVAAVVACVALLLPLPRHPGALGGAIGVVPALAWVAVPFTAGVARRLVVEAGLRERAEADRRLVAHERLRLAHEVHDIVGHALAAIQMQADIALHIGDDTRDQQRAALVTISRASRDAMGDLRSALGTAPPATTSTDLDPPPGLDRLDRLIAGVQAAGTQVRLDVRGRRRILPAGVDLAAYRLVQESLTNVVKHSSQPHAVVTVSHAPDRLELEITNSHHAGADGPRVAGLGTASMRTRVENLGGSFRAGYDHDERRYVVTAVLPTHVEEVTR